MKKLNSAFLLSTTKSDKVEQRCNLSGEEFFSEYVHKKPVLIKGATIKWRAITLWDDDYICSSASELKVQAQYNVTNRLTNQKLTLGEYLNLLKSPKNLEEVPYIYNIPLLTKVSNLVNDITPFPTYYISKWYRDNWWLYTLFFYGQRNTLSPLHFDGMGTHNTFFQVQGTKQFIIVSSENRKNCYCTPRTYPWSPVDPENPDLNKFPKFKNVRLYEAIVEAGDILYMPPLTLHKVRSLERSISFNIDWHTRKSVLTSFRLLKEGMYYNYSNYIYYNLLIAIGLIFNIPSKFLYPLYQKYLNIYS